MSEHKIQGGTMLLFIDPTGGTDYSTVVCLTSVSQSDSVQPVDASSACGPDKSPGTVDISYSFEGQHLQDPDSGKISGTDLRILLRGEQTIGWKLAPEFPVAGDEIQEGTGYLSELSSTYAFDSVGVFSGTIQPYGVPTTSNVPGFYIGQPYGGGYIAYIDGTAQHGIILNDLYPLFSGEWSLDPPVVCGTSAMYGQGYNNTLAIIAATSNSAAQICNSYTGGGYTDWFMPNLNELFYCQSYLPTIDNIWGSAEDNYSNPATDSVVYISGFPTTVNKTSVYDVYAARYF